MNQDLENVDKVNDEFQDNWLNQNLKLIQLDPPNDFTKKVIEQIEVTPNPLSNSPILWILASVPAAILLWLLIFALNSLSHNYQQFDLSFIPDISNIISFNQLSKYVLMVVLGGLFLFGLDYYLNKHLSGKESFYSFLII